MRVTVLYEDQLGLEARGFGPHDLLLACLQDRTGCSRQDLRDVLNPEPKKGNTKLREAIERDLVRMSNRGPVVAVFDSDRVRDCYGLPPRACKVSVLEAAIGHPPRPVAIVLLEQNVDDLVRVCCKELGQPQPRGKPTPGQRDRIMLAAAWAVPAQRAAILEAMPSFRRLVDRVADALNAFIQDNP